MPELPEVEAWRRVVHGWMVDRRLATVHVREPTSVRATLGTRPVPPPPGVLDRVAGLSGLRVEGTARHGKRLGIQLGSSWWLVHLGMTGRFERSPVGAPAPDHARLGWALDDGFVVWFRDARRFGAFVPLAGPQGLEEGLGPDALTPLSGAALAGRFRGRRAIKVALLDQAALAGLGNIHAAEALWRAGIAPDRPVADLDPAAWVRLAAAVPRQLQEALAEIPAVDDFVYVTDGGDNPFAVYGREGEPCPRCGASVSRVVQSGRSTFFCGRCQPSSRP